MLWGEVVIVQGFKADPGWVTVKREDDGVCFRVRSRKDVPSGGLLSEVDPNFTKPVEQGDPH